MKKAAVVLIIFLMILQMTTQLTGCTAQPSSNDTAGTVNPSLSNMVKLTMYMIGDSPTGFDSINTELNRKLLGDINATIDFNFLSWGEYDKKYPLILASGDPFDLIYSAYWIQYDAQAQKGGFMPLDDLLPKYAPQLNAELPQNAIKQCKVNGRLYMIPAMDAQTLAAGFFVRGDIMKRFNIPPIKTLQDFGNYLETVKNNVQGLIPFNLAGTRTDLMSIPCEPPEGDTWDGGFGLGLYILAKYKNPTDIFSFYMTPEYEAFIKMMKSWADRGYWSKSILSNKVSSADAFRNGTSAACITNITDANAKYLAIIKDHPDWDPQYYPVYPDSPCLRDVYKGNGVSIGANSQHPERAMMFLELMDTREDYHDLAFYGIKDTNYALVSGNKLKPVPDKPLYSGEDTSVWGWGNPRFTKYPLDIMPGYEKIIAADNGRAIDSKFAGFVLDTENIKTELAALASVRDQYALPLSAGMVPVDEGLKTLKNKLKIAGIDKVVAEIKKQVSGYLLSGRSPDRM